MKSILLTVLFVSMSATSALAKDEKASAPRKPASAAECLAANKALADSMIKNAAKRIGFSETSEAKLEWISATSDRYVFSASIYKGDYEIVVKTDSTCFPKEVELIDTARK